MEIGNFEDLMLFKNYNLKLKIGRRTAIKQLTYHQGCPVGGLQLSGAVVFQNLFLFPFNPSFNLLKFQLNEVPPLG